MLFGYSWIFLLPRVLTLLWLELLYLTRVNTNGESKSSRNVGRSSINYNIVKRGIFSIVRDLSLLYDRL